MKFFTIDELCNSSVAKQYGIDNTPSPEIVSHLEELGVLLDLIRTNWGSPIRVTSGYRCPVLNSHPKIRGAKNSAHLYGYAADLQPLHPSDFDAFCECVKRSLTAIPFDECIIEKNSKGGRWLHLAVRSYNGQQRRKCLQLEVK